MAEHDDLVAEMPVLEQMGTQERQKLAKKRRLQQLKKWSQREKEWIAKEKQLNKRLANIINEENNGLNLKQYTSYNSNQRKKKPLITQTTTATTMTTTTKGNKLIATNADSLNNNTINGNGNNKLSNGHHHHIPQRSATYLVAGVGRKNEKNFASSGKVHFDVGVMLLEAAARNDFDEVKRLLSLGVSPDSVNHDGLTALHQCCIDASEPMMNLLLEFGANVDARDTEQWTPLHAACTCGHLNLVKILVQYNADLLAVNGDGNMPFDICEDETTLNYIETEMVKQEITQEMIDLTRASAEMQMLTELERRLSEGVEGDDLNIADSMNGVTYLHIAAANNYISVVKFMLKHGVSVNVCDNDLWTPLHGAACWGSDQHVKIVELLVEGGASLDAKTMNDETVFDLCDNIELLEKLNQLKDELENRQANDNGDRLRRTQSRTNSRVHSVRRTSVRDKNQISRREAREEALLRVESETTTTTIATGSTLVQPATNGNDSTTAKIIPTTNDLTSKQVSDESGQSRTNLDHVDSQVPLTTNLDSKFDNGCEQSLADNNVTKIDQQTMVTAEQLSQKGSQVDETNSYMSFSGNNELVLHCHTNNQSLSKDTNDNNHHDPQDTVASTLMRQQSNDNNLPTTVDGQTSGGKKLPLSTSSSNGVMKHDRNMIGVNLITSGDRTNITLPVPGPARNEQPAAQSAVNSCYTNTTIKLDQSQQQLDSISADQHQSITSRSLSQTTTVQVQFAPINYTLSNLKKHRSDLRMRTCNIGGNSINGTNDCLTSNSSHSQIINGNAMTTNDRLSSIAMPPSLANNSNATHTIVTLGPKRQPIAPAATAATTSAVGGGATTILLNPSSSGDNEAHKNQLDYRDSHYSVERPGSPNLTFRKFHGEPGEVVGETKRKSGPKCCIVI